MGFNSLLFIPNDELDRVTKHPKDFALAVRRSAGSITPGPLGFSFSSFSVPYIGHADTAGLVAVGGNHAQCLVQTMTGRGHHTDNGKVELLKALANELGYSVRKKRTKK